VGPHEVNLALMGAHVAAFRARRCDVEVPLVDYPSDRFLVRQLDCSALDALVVEGTYALGLPDLDVRIFLAATHEDTRARREARARDVHEPFVDEVLRIEHRLIAPQAARADLVLDREFRIRARPPGC
jgi:uridine kinase